MLAEEGRAAEPCHMSAQQGMSGALLLWLELMDESASEQQKAQRSRLVVDPTPSISSGQKLYMAAHL